MGLAVVRTIRSPRELATQQDLDDFEQEIVDQYALAMAAAGLSDPYVGSCRSVVIDFARSLPGPLWEASCGDADRYMAEQRRLGQAVTTRAGKAGALAQFYDFVVSRYQGDILALTGVAVTQVIDEFNRQSGASLGTIRVPPSDGEVGALFDSWRGWLAGARKYLPAARDYFAASLWRRVGLRINETAMLDIRDWRPDFGMFGKLHVRHGKGAGGRGPKVRLVPAINGADKLIDWWLAEVRPLFGDDWSNPDAPMLPSEKSSSDESRLARIGAWSLRRGLAMQVDRSLPSWSGRLTPHVLRHYCASSLYVGGMDLKALQELLGHSWLATTSGYIHVRAEHVERAWADANQRATRRLLGAGGK
ncbi:MAG: tyrosine-type recombinase/integrase [Bifidobacteriaceae bacterium]|jgi:site-specific recombinase XerD|nr:tyrosine-type recombinase/integrase [Bifidobacteriaceae bacterium]